MYSQTIRIIGQRHGIPVDHKCCCDKNRRIKLLWIKNICKMRINDMVYSDILHQVLLLKRLLVLVCSHLI